MTLSLDFEECMKDSPNFRDLVHQSENEVMDLESCLDKVLKHCNVAIETGKVHNNATRSFADSIMDVSSFTGEEFFVQDTLRRFSRSMTELSDFQSTLFDQAQRSVKTQLSKFLKDDVRSTRDMKKSFDKISDEYSAAMSKHAAVSRLKPSEIDDAFVNLTTTRNSFRNISMDYVGQINTLHRKTSFQMIDKMLSYMHALVAFFHQGYDLMKDLEPFLKDISTKLDDMSKTTESKRKSMVVKKERHQSMTGDSGIYMKCESDAIVIEGHLFKRASNAFKTWNRNYESGYLSSVKKFMWWSGITPPRDECESVYFERRWFTIKENKLFYQKKKDDLTVIVDDIRLVTVRNNDEVERRFCFEIISPGKSFLLQAETEDARLAWIKAIQSSIGEAFKETMQEMADQPSSNLATSKALKNPVPQSSPSNIISPSESPKTNKSDKMNPTSFLEEDHPSIIAKISEVPGNKLCADCGRSDPRWASISLGVTLCIECSGVHRSLGVHVSKVRSLTMDRWEPEVIKIMMKLGNDRVNEVYNANLPHDKGIKPSCTSQDRLAYIKAKYCSRTFVMPLPSVFEHQPAYRGTKGQRLTRWAVSKRKPIPRHFQTTNPSITDDIVLEKDLPTINVTRQQSGHSRDSLFLEDELNSLFSYFDPLGESEGDSDDVIVFGPSASTDTSKDLTGLDVMDISLLNANLLLYKATVAANLPVIMLARGNGADLNWSNPDAEGKTALMQAGIVGSIPACEYLLLNGSKINARDNCLRTALHYACLHNHTGVACQLLKRRVEMDLVDENGQSALDLAVEAANADIVTLIRLKKMNEQMREDNNSTYQTDALVSDVFRDFSSRTFSSLHSPDPNDANRKFGILGGATVSPPSEKSPSKVPNESHADCKTAPANGQTVEHPSERPSVAIVTATDETTAINLRETKQDSVMDLESSV